LFYCNIHTSEVSFHRNCVCAYYMLMALNASEALGPAAQSMFAHYTISAVYILSLTNTKSTQYYKLPLIWCEIIITKTRKLKK